MGSYTWVFNMIGSKVLVLGLCLGSSLAVRQLRGNSEARGERSLVGTFPFNANLGDNQEHHHAHHEVDNNRLARQGDDGVDVSFGAVAGARPGPDGKKCIDKVEMVEETEYDEVEQCDHSYDKRCHTTYVTNYESQQEEECDENFRKSCFIQYEQIAFNETVQICRTPLVKDCDIQGPEICRTEYESECWTK